MHEVQQEHGHDHFRSGRHYAETFKGLALGLTRDGHVAEGRRLATMYGDFLAELKAVVMGEVRAKWGKPASLEMVMLTRELEPEHADQIEARMRELVDLAFEQAAYQRHMKRVLNPPNGGKN